ncbi:hypothetical protein KKI24_20950 [bacterium]|nr:hypothetical protein [bacterium]
MNVPFDMNYFLAFGFIGICIFVGVLLRAKVPLLQRFLVPSCMIGGILGMIAINMGWVPLDENLFQGIAYHFFIVSFISIGLTRTVPGTGEKHNTRERLRGAFWMGMMNGASMASQAFIACVMVLLFGLLGVVIPLQFGLFLPLGFTQGPGQALAIGKAWEAAGLTNAVTIGLAFAAIGFVFALFVGIPIVNWGIRKGYSKMGKVELPDYFRRGTYREDQIGESMGTMTTHSANVDSLAFQAGAVGIAYLLTYIGFILLEQFTGELKSSTWGFFFFYGMLSGLLIKFIMNKTGSGYLLDTNTQNRITGFSVDILVAATLISVKLSVVWDNIVALMLITIVGGIWTTFMVFYFGRRMNILGFERMCVQYGVNTGTISTGLLLLRVVDPEFKTGVALETGLYSIFATPFILGAMLVIVYYPQWGLNIYQQMGIYLGMFVLTLVLMKVFKVWGKKAW